MKNNLKILLRKHLLKEETESERKFYKEIEKRKELIENYNIFEDPKAKELIGYFIEKTDREIGLSQLEPNRVYGGGVKSYNVEGDTYYVGTLDEFKKTLKDAALKFDTIQPHLVKQDNYYIYIMDWLR